MPRSRPCPPALALASCAFVWCDLVFTMSLQGDENAREEGWRGRAQWNEGQNASTYFRPPPGSLSPFYLDRHSRGRLPLLSRCQSRLSLPQEFFSLSPSLCFSSPSLSLPKRGKRGGGWIPRLILKARPPLYHHINWELDDG